VPGLILAVVNPDNTPHGYNWTFVFPMLLFAVIAAILYLLFSRPHRRIPAKPITATASSQAPHPSAARAASVAAEPPAAGGATSTAGSPTGAEPGDAGQSTPPAAEDGSEADE